MSKPQLLLEPPLTRRLLARLLGAELMRRSQASIERERDRRLHGAARLLQRAS